MGGELKITARFPEGTVEITQFEAVKKAAAGDEDLPSPTLSQSTRTDGHPATKDGVSFLTCARMRFSLTDNS